MYIIYFIEVNYYLKNNIILIKVYFLLIKIIIKNRKVAIKSSICFSYKKIIILLRFKGIYKQVMFVTILI